MPRRARSTLPGGHGDATGPAGRALTGVGARPDPPGCDTPPAARSPPSPQLRSPAHPAGVKPLTLLLFLPPSRPVGVVPQPRPGAEPALRNPCAGGSTPRPGGALRRSGLCRAPPPPARCPRSTGERCGRGERGEGPGQLRRGRGGRRAGMRLLRLLPLRAVPAGRARPLPRGPCPAVGELRGERVRGAGGRRGRGVPGGMGLPREGIPGGSAGAGRATCCERRDGAPGSAG